MKKTFIYVALIALLSSCSSEQVTNPVSQGDVKLTLNGSVTGTVSVNTKADPINLAPNTTVGVYAWQTSNEPAGSSTTLANTTLANALYTVNNSGEFTSTSYLQLFSDRTYQACAYSPHKAASLIGTSVSFVHGDDVLYAPESSVVFASNPTTASTTLGFTHKMSQIRLLLKSGLGSPSLDNVTVKISGFINSCSMDLTNGAITNGPDKTAVINQVQKLTGENLSALTPFCIIPGTLTLTIEINAGGVNYKKVCDPKEYKLSESNELALTLNKTTTSLNVVGKVTNWTIVPTTPIDIPSI